MGYGMWVIICRITVLHPMLCMCEVTSYLRFKYTTPGKDVRIPKYTRLEHHIFEHMELCYVYGSLQAVWCIAPNHTTIHVYYIIIRAYSLTSSLSHTAQWDGVREAILRCIAACQKAPSNAQDASSTSLFPPSTTPS